MRIGNSIKIFARLCLMVVASLPSLQSHAQKVSEFDKLRATYANDNAVFVSRKEDAVVKMENDVPIIYSNISEDLLLLTDKTEAYMEREIYWSDFSEIKNMNAFTLVPSGKKYKTLKVSDFTRSNEITDGAFYDDSRAYRFVYPSLVNGSHAVYSYTEKVEDPHLYGRFFFNSFAPAEDVEYSITFPSNVKVSYKLFNANDTLIKFSSRVSGKNTTYSWTLLNAKKIKSEGEAPNIAYYVPHVVVLIDEYTVNGVTKKVMSGVPSLYDWYYAYVKDINKDVSPELKKVVDSITMGVTDSLEKVKRIFNWVQNNITYIAYEDSLGGVIPREASLVCSRRFGDCKDMASTLTEMIRTAGLPAYQTWIGTRDIPYHFADVPSPIATNHMICTYMQGNKKYFMDATGKDAPFGFFTSMIQGKEALVGMGKDKYEVVKIPEIEMTKNVLSDTTLININNTHIQGKGVVDASGYDKILIGQRIQNMEKKERYNYMTGFLQKGNNKFNVDSLAYENLNDRNKELGIRYNFSLDNYAQKNGDELYVNMALDKEYMNDLIEQDREAPREIEYKNIKRNVNILQIPKGYKVSYLPENSSFKSDGFGYDINYTVKNNTIVNEKSVYINTLMMGPKDFAEWNKMIKQLSRAYGETVTLVKQ
jgi:transglutaminase-like putative cysteine protease